MPTRSLEAFASGIIPVIGDILAQLLVLDHYEIVKG